MDTYHRDPEDDPGDDSNDGIGDVESVADVIPPRVVPPTLVFCSGEHFSLGSHKGVITIGKLLRREAGDDAFTSFCSRVSVAVKSLSPELSAVVIDESCQVRYYLLAHVDHKPVLITAI